MKRKIFFNGVMPERLRTLRHCIFTGGFLETNSLSLATLDSSPKGTPLGCAGNFAATAEAVPLRADFPRPGEDVAQRQKGEFGLPRSGKTEGVLPEVVLFKVIRRLFSAFFLKSRFDG